MSADQEKERISDEVTRVDPAAPILPIVNPATEKSELPKAGLHPSVYVMYVKKLMNIPIFASTICCISG